jgi:hypothetical protein
VLISSTKITVQSTAGVTAAALFLAAKTGPAKVEAVMSTTVTVYTFAWYAVPARDAKLEANMLKNDLPTKSSYLF